jgi:AMP-binding enzyme/Phosphopantetheine attachment site/AMP-binding enzyme C-terminal domain
VHVTYKEIGESEIAAGASNIGRPIPTLTTYVLDANMQPVPVGVAGEICVGGLGVARGYLNRPELTAERFVSDPFGGERLYRSGDVGRVLPGGDIEYLGRRDQQIKLRGFRIEPGEIEAAVTSTPDVSAAAVVIRESAGGDPRLVCYFVPAVGAAPTAFDLLNRLRAVLPAHMVPSALIRLAALPLTPNGKLDRKALPEPEALEDEHPYTPPRGVLEETIAGVWADVLAVPRVSVDRNFFELGGHSLLATQVVARVTRLFRMRVTLRRFFEHPTVREFAAALVATEPKPGHAETIAGAIVRLREMTPEERERLRSARGA